MFIDKESVEIPRYYTILKKDMKSRNAGLLSSIKQM